MPKTVADVDEDFVDNSADDGSTSDSSSEEGDSEAATRREGRPHSRVYDDPANVAWRDGVCMVLPPGVVKTPRGWVSCSSTERHRRRRNIVEEYGNGLPAIPNRETGQATLHRSMHGLDVT